MSSELGTLTAKLTADNSQFDETQKKSAEVATASGKMREKAAKLAAEAEAFAAQFVGDTVTAQSRRVVDARKLESAAAADMRKAQALNKAGYLGEEAGANLVAAALQRLTAARAATANALKEEASSMAEAAAAANVSSNVWVASFERVALVANESLGEVQEKLIQTAETAKLSEGGIGGGFGALSGLLGAGIAVGFAGHFIDEVSKANVELDHLSAKTGIAVGTLSGLKLVVQEMGGDFDAVATGLVRLEKAQASAASGSGKALEAFHAIGISLKEVQNLKTEDLLQRVSEAFEQHNNRALQAAVAIALFGKGGAALIPVLREQGSSLGENIDKAAQMTGVTKEAAEASRKWTKDMADLSVELMMVAEKALPYVEGTLHKIAAGFLEAGAAVQTVAEVIGSTFEAIGASAIAGGQMMADAASGNYGALLQDAKTAKDQFVDIWKSTAADIRKANKFADDFAQAKPSAAPPALEQPEDPLGDGLGGGTGGNKAAAALRKAAEAQHQAMEAALAEKKNDHAVSTAEEYTFWAGMIEAAQKYPENLQKVMERMGQLNQEMGRQLDEIVRQANEANTKKLEQQKRNDEEMIRLDDEMNKQQRRSADFTAQLSAVNQENANALQEMAIAHDVATGAISKHDAAIQTAAEHAATYAAKLQALRDEQEADNNDASLTADQRQANQDGRDVQAAKIQGAADRTALQDSWAVQQQTAVSGFLSALQELTAAGKDTAAQFKSITLDLVNGVNKTIVELLTSHSNKTPRQQFESLGHDLATKATAASLSAGEASLLSMFSGHAASGATALSRSEGRCKIANLEISTMANLPKPVAL
jgi:hypothetical protein